MREHIMRDGAWMSHAHAQMHNGSCTEPMTDMASLCAECGSQVAQPQLSERYARATDAMVDMFDSPNWRGHSRRFLERKKDAAKK